MVKRKINIDLGNITLCGTNNRHDFDVMKYKLSYLCLYVYNILLDLSRIMHLIHLFYLQLSSSTSTKKTSEFK